MTRRIRVELVGDSVLLRLEDERHVVETMLDRDVAARVGWAIVGTAGGARSDGLEDAIEALRLEATD